MLKNVHPLLTPDLLYSLALMGHGDRIAIVDANFPAASHHDRVHALFGSTTLQAARAVIGLLPLDTFVTPAAHRMVPDGDPGFRSPAHDEMDTALTLGSGRRLRAAAVERTDFYALARGAFAIVHTTDDRPFSCFLLTKGVVSTVE